MTESQDLSDRQFVVTGASRGIGRSIVAHLGRKGAKVIAIARSKQALEELVGSIAGGRHRALAIDVTDEKAWEDLGELVEPTGLDGLVTAAGRITPIGPIESIDVAEFRATLDVNLVGTFLAIKQCLPFFQKPRASIVTFSGGGATAPFPRFDAYASSKAAVVRLTENLAFDLAARGIRVNSIAPGFVNSEMQRATLEAGPELVGYEHFERTRKAVTEGTADSPVAATELVEFLLSDAGSAVTGKLVSALWDPWREAAFVKDLTNDRDLATIRRIDRQRFVVAPEQVEH